MTIKRLFYLAIFFSTLRLGISISIQYLLVEKNMDPLNLGLISGTINIFFWISILWLIVKVLMTEDLKKYLKLSIPLIVIVILITKSSLIGTLILGNTNRLTTPENTANNNFQLNKVYIDPNYDGETIEPKDYYSTGKEYKIFIFNQTIEPIKANQKVTIKPNESYLFKIPDTMGIALDNGIQFFFGETEGLEVIDNNIQVLGLGGEWLSKRNVPESADFAFSILNPGEGDPIPEE
jgi:hypothetical protein